MRNEPFVTGAPIDVSPVSVHVAARPRLGWQALVMAGSVAVILFFSVYNLASFPLTWFDEGSHLHVPKAVIRLGAYADYSSDGFRYFGPTIGVGPTVLLPVAAAFRAFGIGLLQARLVMVLYLLAAIVAFYRLARVLGGRRLAWVATALFVTSRGVSLFEYGRQVLGEVPGFFFLAAGLALWLATWERSSWRRLALVGLLLGLSVVTKNQYLLVIAPAIGLAWLANLLYYRLAPQRVFVVPGVMAVGAYGLWQLFTLVYLGPANTLTNLALFRDATAGAALVFSPDLVRLSLQDLLSFKVYLGLLFAVLVYGLSRVLPRERDAQRWGLLFIMIVVNLLWYIVASISWERYAFPALALSALFVARLFSDVTGGLHLDLAALRESLRRNDALLPDRALRAAILASLLGIIAVPLIQTGSQIISPPFNAPAAMAAYLTRSVPANAVVETWEPEMGFLTDLNFHYPPSGLLNKAVAYIWLNGAPVAQFYDFERPAAPDYVLVGTFGRWVAAYPLQKLEQDYHLVASIGDYDLYQRDASLK
jgi:4-amino-4-deoxy-L-arabinose transferase-like glycosyltransferase